MKQVRVGTLRTGDEFFHAGTNHVKQKWLHNNCYEDVENKSFGLGISGCNKGYIVVLKNDDLVQVEETKVLVSSLRRGDKIRLDKGGHIYTLAKDASDMPYAIGSDFLLIQLTNSGLVYKE
jgi:hypothetical protein